MSEDILTVVDKNYMLQTVLDRKDILKERWRMLLAGKDRDGEEITSTATINRYRVIVSRDMEMCALVEELLMRITDKELFISTQAEKGFEKLADPKERRMS